MHPDVSVVISTYNRADSLEGAINGILAQQVAVGFELIVVDNNCTDGTASLIQRYAARDGRVRYIFEPRQGVSYGRNAGIAAARASLIAFTDDDVVVAIDWLDTIKAAFDAKPDHGCVGGKVLPLWPSPPPSWLTPAHWAPLALLAYGEAQSIGAHNRRCLITANMAVRRQVFDQIGLFRPEFQKTIGSTCSVEDMEIQNRYWEAGGLCWYSPEITVRAGIQPNRLTKDYHRRWHYSHGRLLALLRDPAVDIAGPTILGVPRHLWRQLVTQSAHTIYSLAAGHRDEAFHREVKMRFAAGFILARVGGAGR